MLQKCLASTHEACVTLCERFADKNVVTVKEMRLYIISSKQTDEDRTVRLHWEFEYNLHRQSDLSFDEDDSRKCGYSAQNFYTLKRISLNCIEHGQSKNRSIKGNWMDADRNDDYLLKILTD